MEFLTVIKIISLLSLGLLIWMNFLWFRSFTTLFRSSAPEAMDDRHLPRTLVMLCLRGNDPFLKETLMAIARQSYRNFDLRTVIDHPEDSSVDVVRQFEEESGFDRLQIRYLHQRRQTCGLKVSALLQELTDLDEEYEVIVQVDADAVPYPGWLKEMITPLCNPEVGVTSGLRWYMPDRSSWASLIRYVWGISGTVQMYRFGMPWGGSLAFRRELLTRTNLLALWRNSLTEDLVFDAVLDQADLRLQFVPAVMVNREETSLQDCYSFVSRQVFMARHYHSAWWKVASFALLNGTFFLTSLICSSGGHSSIGNIAYAGWMGLLAYPVFYALLIAQTERVIRRKVALQGGALTPVDYRYILAQVPALLIHLAAAASAMIRRHVSWRGVAYQVSRGGHVRILRDEPLLVRLDRDRQTSIV